MCCGVARPLPAWRFDPGQAECCVSPARTAIIPGMKRASTATLARPTRDRILPPAPSSNQQVPARLLSRMPFAPAAPATDIDPPLPGIWRYSLERTARRSSRPQLRRLTLDVLWRLKPRRCEPLTYMRAGLGLAGFAQEGFAFCARWKQFGFLTQAPLLLGKAVLQGIGSV
jgi:hypothetical protein